jgi:phage gp37-like protein
MILAALEDAIVARLRDAFGDRVREVDHRPDQLDAEALSRLLSMAPAAYVALLGLRRRNTPDGTWDSSWGVYLVAANASGERARRRGDVATIGAYEMVEIAVRVIDGWGPNEAAGSFDVVSAEQLQADAFDRMGRTVHALAIEVPVELPRGIDPADLVPFVTFDAAWDVPPFGNVSGPLPPPDAGVGGRDAGDRIALDQE